MLRRCVWHFGMSLISATTPTEAPQTGVKRALSGNPTSVPGSLPAFRGRKVSDPERDIKVPKLTQGNRPNEGSNIAIPYNRRVARLPLFHHGAR